MLRYSLLVGIICLCLFKMGTAQEQLAPGQPTLSWETLDPVPNATGLAGPIVGVHDQVLIVAGGANFPNGVPWHPTNEGGVSKKTYHDKIYFKKSWEEPWQTTGSKLTKPLAYGTSISTEDGILVFGGHFEEHNENKPSEKRFPKNCFCLRFAETTNNVEVSGEWQGKALPPLPFGTTSLVGGKVGNSVFLLTGETEEGAKSELWKLDLNREKLEFEVVGAFPGESRGFAVGAIQNDGRENCLFVFSGRNQVNGRFRLLTDYWKFVPSESKWYELGEISVSGESEPRCMMAGYASPYGANHIILAGESGEVFEKLNNDLTFRIQSAVATGNESLAADLTKEKNDLLDNHPGFGRELFCFNAITSSFYQIGESPEGKRQSTGPDGGKTIATGGHVTTTSVAWNGRIIIPSGEIAPGVRSPNVYAFKVDQMNQGLGLTNWLVMGGYLLVLVGIGFYFSRGEMSSADYFVASGRVPWWAAGLSVFATMLSAITYLSIPARAYGTDWTYFTLNLGIPFCCVFVMIFYLPFYRKLNITSAYEYLEARYHWTLRVFGALTFVAFQFGRMGIVVLLPALALSAVTGINVYLCIITMGVLATTYTVLGGVEAVVWTDVLQTVVLFGGAIAAVVIVAQSMDGGFADLWLMATQNNKTQFVRNWHQHDLSWTKDGIIVCIIGAVFVNLLPYSSDQAVVQRYMTVKDEKAARKAIWTNALLCIPATFVFYLVGAALWVYFTRQPETLAPIAKPDQVFPWFFFFQMPAGLAGLVFAGVLAAAMSSLDSSMHSMATVISRDFYQLFNPKVSDKTLLSFAKRMTLVLGILGTISACVLASFDVQYLLDLFLKIIGLLLGPVSGLFALGIFFRNTNSFHAWIAVICSAGTLIYMNVLYPWNGGGTLVHPFVNGGIAMGVCVGVGWLMSVLIPSTGSKRMDLVFFSESKDH